MDTPYLILTGEIWSVFGECFEENRRVIKKFGSIIKDYLEYLKVIFWFQVDFISGLILSLHPANERRRYFITISLIGWAQA